MHLQGSLETIHGRTTPFAKKRAQKLEGEKKKKRGVGALKKVGKTHREKVLCTLRSGNLTPPDMNSNSRKEGISADKGKRGGRSEKRDGDFEKRRPSGPSRKKGGDG